ncbi:MAG TPA: XisI protein [Saprospiraceae bacterium]|nr:XisI protein [Saprospiraceae bacterium]
MEKLLNYQKALREVLQSYLAGGTIPQDPDLETQLLIDEEGNRYQILHLGWKNSENVFLVIFYFEIKDGKIWVHRNISDYDIIGDLEEKGIRKEDIVLAFHSPKMRPYTGYAVA